MGNTGLLGGNEVGGRRLLKNHQPRPRSTSPPKAYRMPDQSPLEPPADGVGVAVGGTGNDCLQSLGQLNESSPRSALQIPSSLQNELSLTGMVKTG